MGTTRWTKKRRSTQQAPPRLGKMQDITARRLGHFFELMQVGHVGGTWVASQPHVTRWAPDPDISEVIYNPHKWPKINGFAWG